jgi:hypothetical protein
LPTQKLKSELCVPHQLPFFVVVTIMLQIPQSAVDCRRGCIHTPNELLAVRLNNGSGEYLIPTLRFTFVHATPDSLIPNYGGVA